MIPSAIATKARMIGDYTKRDVEPSLRLADGSSSGVSIRLCR
jgi:hypothetical protein